MKVYVDISKPSIIKFDDEGRNIFKGDNLVDAVKVYCTEKPSDANLWYLLISAQLSNGRVTRSIDADGPAIEELEDGKTWYRYDFTLSRANGITLCEGMATFFIQINHPSARFEKNKTIGSFNAYVYKSEELEDNILIVGGNAGDIIKNFQAEIDDLRAILAGYNAHFLTKQDTLGLDIPNEVVDAWTNEVDFFNYFWANKTKNTRYYQFIGYGENKIFDILDAKDIYNQILDRNKSWKIMIDLSGLAVDADNRGFSILVRIIDTDINGNTNYVKQLYTNSLIGLQHKLKSTGWIDLNYVAQVKERLTNVEAALVYNNVGLLYVSDYDEETGMVTLIANPSLVRSISDVDPETGIVKVYVKPHDFTDYASKEGK